MLLVVLSCLLAPCFGGRVVTRDIISLPVDSGGTFRTGHGVSFNIVNTNAYPVYLQRIDCPTSTTGAHDFELWTQPDGVTGDPNSPKGGNMMAAGYTMMAMQTSTSTATNTPQECISGINILLAAGSTTGVALVMRDAANLRYYQTTATFTASDGGINAVTGDSVGFGFIFGNTAEFTPRFFFGQLYFDDLQPAPTLWSIDSFPTGPFLNSNGITFDVENTNAYSIFLDGVDCPSASALSHDMELWAIPGGVSGFPLVSAETLDPGYVQMATETVLFATPNSPQPCIQGIAVEISPGATVGFALVMRDAQDLRYKNAGSEETSTIEGTVLTIGGSTGWGFFLDDPSEQSFTQRRFFGSLHFSTMQMTE